MRRRCWFRCRRDDDRRRCEARRNRQGQARHQHRYWWTRSCDRSYRLRRRSLRRHWYGSRFGHDWCCRCRRDGLWRSGLHRSDDRDGQRWLNGRNRCRDRSRCRTRRRNWRRSNWCNDRRLRCDDGCGRNYGLGLLRHDRRCNRCCDRRNWYRGYWRTRRHRRHARSRHRGFRRYRRRNGRRGRRHIRTAIGILVVEVEHDRRGRIMCVEFCFTFVLATAASATATAAARARRFIARRIGVLRR